MTPQPELARARRFHLGSPINKERGLGLEAKSFFELAPRTRQWRELGGCYRLPIVKPSCRWRPGRVVLLSLAQPQPKVHLQAQVPVPA